VRVAALDGVALDAAAVHVEQGPLEDHQHGTNHCATHGRAAVRLGDLLVPVGYLLGRSLSPGF